MLDRFNGGNHAQLNKPVQLALFLWLNIGIHIQPACCILARHLPGDLTGNVRDFKMLNA